MLHQENVTPLLVSVVYIIDVLYAEDVTIRTLNVDPTFRLINQIQIVIFFLTSTLIPNRLKNYPKAKTTSKKKKNKCLCLGVNPATVLSKVLLLLIPPPYWVKCCC